MSAKTKAKSDLVMVSIKVPPERLDLIDANAAELGMNRTEYLIAQGCAPEAARALKLYEGLKEVQGIALALAQRIDDMLEAVDD